MSGHEGSTPAAWVTVVILILASLVGAIAIVVGNWMLFGIGGVGVAVIGLIVGKAMAVAAKNRDTAKV